MLYHVSQKVVTDILKHWISSIRRLYCLPEGFSFKTSVSIYHLTWCNMKVQAFWYVTSCCWVSKSWQLKELWCLHLKDQAVKEQLPRKNSACYICMVDVGIRCPERSHVALIFFPQWLLDCLTMKLKALPSSECQELSQIRQNITSQKTWVFSNTSVDISNFVVATAVCVCHSWYLAINILQ